MGKTGANGETFGKHGEGDERKTNSIAGLIILAVAGFKGESHSTGYTRFDPNPILIPGDEDEKIIQS